MSERVGRISLLATCPALAHDAEARLDALGALVDVIEVPSLIEVPSALDAAARSERTTVIALALHDVASPRELGSVLGAVSPHLPQVVFAPGLELGGDSQAAPETSAERTSAAQWARPWLESCGVIEARSIGELADISSICANGYAPAGPLAQVIGNDGRVGAIAAHLHATGFRPSVVVSATPIAAACEALSKTDVDAIALAWPSDAALDDVARLAQARADHPELQLAVVLPADTAMVGRAIVETGISTVGTYSAPARGWSSLARWERRIAEPRPESVPIDRARVRRALRELGTRPIRTNEEQELLSALGLAVAPLAEVGYVDDAPLAAAELGYPVRVISDSEVVVTESETLINEVEAALARMRAQGDDSSVVLRAERSEPMAGIRIERDPRFGLCLTVHAGGRTLRRVSPWTAGALALSLVSLGPEHARGLERTASSLIDLLRLDERIESAEVVPLWLTSRGLIGESIRLIAARMPE